MIRRYYADVLGDDSVQRVFYIDDPDEGPPTPPTANGTPQYIGTAFSWDAPSDTSKPTWPAGATAIVWVETASLGDMKAAKLAELASAFSTRMATIKAGYPEEEVSSWFKQEAEARAYTADSSAATPLLSAMATARNITVADLAARVISNADAWSATSGAIIGKRQAYEDAVNAASDAATVAAIVWTD